MAEGVCGGAGEGGKRQRTTAAPTKLGDRGGRLALRPAPRSGGIRGRTESLFTDLSSRLGVGEEESPVPAPRHIWSSPEHLAELAHEPHTSQLSELRCLHDPHGP